MKEYFEKITQDIQLFLAPEEEELEIIKQCKKMMIMLVLAEVLIWNLFVFTDYIEPLFLVISQVVFCTGIIFVLFAGIKLKKQQVEGKYCVSKIKVISVKKSLGRIESVFAEDENKNEADFYLQNNSGFKFKKGYRYEITYFYDEENKPTIIFSKKLGKYKSRLEANIEEKINHLDNLEEL